MNRRINVFLEKMQMRLLKPFEKPFTWFFENYAPDYIRSYHVEGCTFLYYRFNLKFILRNIFNFNNIPLYLVSGVLIPFFLIIILAVILALISLCGGWNKTYSTGILEGIIIQANKYDKDVNRIKVNVGASAQNSNIKETKEFLVDDKMFEQSKNCIKNKTSVIVNYRIVYVSNFWKGKTDTIAESIESLETK